MTNFTTEQLELQSHIEADNARRQAEAGPNDFVGTLVSDPAHWAEYGITNVVSFEKQMAVEAYINIYKDINGIKPRHIDFDSMTTTEIEQGITSLLELEQTV